jgi:hypothetical protein
VHEEDERPVACDIEPVLDDGLPYEAVPIRQEGKRSRRQRASSPRRAGFFSALHA